MENIVIVVSIYALLFDMASSDITQTRMKLCKQKKNAYTCTSIRV
jgi:hypothetical protein